MLRERLFKGESIAFVLIQLMVVWSPANLFKLARKDLIDTFTFEDFKASFNNDVLNVEQILTLKHH